MSDLNSVNFTGRLTADVTSRQAGEHTIYIFGLAVSGSKKDEVHFFNCEAWNKTGEIISKYFSKGSRIGISGKLIQRRWESDGKKLDRISIAISDFTFLDKKQDGADKVQKEFDGEQNPFSDDDIPF